MAKPKSGPASRAVPSPMLLALVAQFLERNGFNSSHRIFNTERRKRPKKEGWQDTFGRNYTAQTPPLEKIFQFWEQQQKKSKTTHSSSDDDTSSESELETDKAVILGAIDAKSSVPPTSLKRKAPSTSSSSDTSDASDDTSDSESEPDDKPAPKKQRMQSESSSSESDDSTDSDSDDALNNVDAVSDNSSSEESSSSQDSEDSGSSSEEDESEETETIQPPRKTSSDSSGTITADAPLTHSVSEPAAVADQVKSQPVIAGKKKHVGTQPTRLAALSATANPDDYVSNTYVSYDYADKAFKDLSVTRGKGFTKEKNKKKRGSYRGGTIDTNGGKGFKFDD